MTNSIDRTKKLLFLVAMSLMVAVATIVLGDSAVPAFGGLMAACLAIIFIVILLANYPLALRLFLVLIPLQYIDLSAGRMGFYLSPVRLGLPLMLAGWLLYRIRRPKSDVVVDLNFRLLLPLIGFLILVGLSVIFGKDPAAGVDSSIRLAEGIVIFVIIIDVLRTKKLLNSTIFFVSIAVGIISISLVHQFLLSPNEFFTAASKSYDVTTRAVSILGQSNTAANSVAILFPLLLYSAIIARSKIGAWAFRGLALLTVLGVLLTVSRGGLLGLIVGVLASFRHRLDKIFLVLLLAMIVILSTPFPDFWMGSIGARPASSSSRLDLMRVGLWAGLAHPILGTGFGTFTALPEHVDFSIPFSIYEEFNRTIRPAHNLYMAILVETGVLSLVFFGFFWWRLLRSLLALDRHVFSANMKQEWWLTQFLIGCSTAFLITRLFTSGFFTLSFWVLLAILISGSSTIAGRVDTRLDHGSVEPAI